MTPLGKLGLVALMGIFCSTTVAAQILQKVFPYPPDETFEVAAANLRFRYGASSASADRRNYTIRLSIPRNGPSELVELRVKMVFSGVPNGCGTERPCTATKVFVYGYRLTFGGMLRSRVPVSVEDVAPILSQLQKALHQSRISIQARGVNAGPFAAAELHTWAPRNKRRFVVVRVEYKSRPGTLLCAPYTAALRTDSGKEYAPGVGIESTEPEVVIPVPRLGSLAVPSHRQAGVSDHSYASYDLLRTYDFAVGPTDRPKALDLNLASNVRAACEAESGSDWNWLAEPSQVSLPLAGLPEWSDLTVLRQRSARVRFGQLEVAVTGVARINEPNNRAGAERLGIGYYSVLVALGVQNSSKDPDCTRFSARLLTDHGYQASQFSSSLSSLPKTYGLMSGEVSGGTVAFTIWKSSTPVALVLERNLRAEKSCAVRLGRLVDTHGGATVRIPLRSVPENRRPVRKIERK